MEGSKYTKTRESVGTLSPHSETQQWLTSYAININALPVPQYSLDCPYVNMSKVEKNRVIQIDIMNLENHIAWISPTPSLGRKMTHYKTLFTHIREWIPYHALLY